MSPSDARTGSCSGSCGSCLPPSGNSVTRNDAQSIPKYDVAIVGCGVVGASIARELSKYKLSVLVLERENDVSQGASKANSGCVHGGYDAKHGTLKSKLSRKGNQLFPALNEDLDFGFQMCGSLVLAFQENEVADLKRLKENGEKNGVDDLEILTGDQVREMEPHISVGVQAALHCPTAGIVTPYEYCYALVENASANGVDFRVGHRLVGIDRLAHLASKTQVFRLHCDNGAAFDANYVVNAAGLFTDQVARMAGCGTDYSITPRKGQYVLLEKSQGTMASRIIFQTPTKRWGKGIVVTPTSRGNLLIGPSASEETDKEGKDTDISELAYVAWASRRSVPHLDTRQNLKSFAGLRARSSREDFIIEQDAQISGFVHCAGIESPGLTSSPAIAKLVCEILANQPGLELIPKPNFNPKRKHPVDLLPGKEERISADDEIICKCEQITRAEIERAIDCAGIPITSTDAVKWRTRAGMGHCQGARCRVDVADIIAEKLKDPKVTFQNVPQQVPGSHKLSRVARSEISKL